MEHLVSFSINTDLFFSVFINELSEEMYNIIVFNYSKLKHSSEKIYSKEHE